MSVIKKLEKKRMVLEDIASNPDIDPAVENRVICLLKGLDEVMSFSRLGFNLKMLNKKVDVLDYDSVQEVYCKDDLCSVYIGIKQKKRAKRYAMIYMADIKNLFE